FSRDWSSDVCSSDLLAEALDQLFSQTLGGRRQIPQNPIPEQWFEPGIRFRFAQEQAGRRKAEGEAPGISESIDGAKAALAQMLGDAGTIAVGIPNRGGRRGPQRAPQAVVRRFFLFPPAVVRDVVVEVAVLLLDPDQVCQVRVGQAGELFRRFGVPGPTGDFSPFHAGPKGPGIVVGGVAFL